MKKEKFDKYMTERYKDQIAWYSDSAARNKVWYQGFPWGVIVLSAVVPF